MVGSNLEAVSFSTCDLASLDGAGSGGVMVTPSLATRTGRVEARAARASGRRHPVVRRAFGRGVDIDVDDYVRRPTIHRPETDRATDLLVDARSAVLRLVLRSDFGDRQRAGLLRAIPRARVARVATRSAAGSGAIADAKDAIASAFSLQYVERDYRFGARSR